MCGIVGIIGTAPVADRLVMALKRLEYRGYDSAGVATIEDGAIVRRRAEGKLGNLDARLKSEPLGGLTGIGHTRWATHGGPTERNAHPHATEKVAVVHNGIIENFRELREELRSAGAKFATETDTEVVAHLISAKLKEGLAPEAAVGEALKRLRGAFALAFLFRDAPDTLIAARQASPLAIGHGEEEMYFGSDAYALAAFTNRVTYLEEGDWAVVKPGSVLIRTFDGKTVERQMVMSSASAAVAEKGNHRHFMAKEIYEQPEAISHALAHYVDMAEMKVKFHEKLPIDFARLTRLTLVACGTASYAAMVGKYWFERYARLPVDVDVASEFRYREPVLAEGGLSLFISQSGETADTLAALRHCAAEGQAIASIVNVAESTIARESQAVFPILCGPEIGVASTKAFTAQLTVLASLAIAAGRARGALSEDDEHRLVEALVHLPSAMAETLKTEPQVEELAKRFRHVHDVLYLGRGQMFPIALEGALKLKEISYIHAEGYAGGELKHGPIALIDENMPVVVVAPSDALMEKTLSNMQEVAARGGKIILITDQQGADTVGTDVADLILLPKVDELVAPIIAALPVQMLAYHTAVQMGTDVDQPRNLAKSVTVE